MSEISHSLQESLDLYTAQLKQIQDALVIASEEQKPDLQQVAQNLEEIIQLTQTSLSSETAEHLENSVEEEKSHLENELTALEGVKCKVPFKYEWGGIGYHNAIILGSELDEDNTVHVKTVFMHPTTKRMQPCPYFLEGSCKYSDEKCHYSHGYVVRMDQLQDYIDPDFSKITEGCTVLAKYKDELWYKGIVEDIIKETEFSVKFLHCKDALLLNFHSVYPLDGDEDDSSSENSSDEDDDDFQFTPRSIEEHRMEQPSRSFGSWEKHTRGIGSILMTKMGYIQGSGLGKEGEGRVEPVEAMVFPAGRSLDRCMELREKAGSEDMLTVEKKLERQKAKAEQRLKQMASATESQKSVFDFINSKLTNNTTQGSKAETSHARRKMESADLSRLSREKLNVQSLQIGEQIRRAERELTKIKETLQRQIDRGDLASVSHIRTRLAEKETELDRLHASDRTIVNEQKQRKSSSKLTIF